MTIDELFQKAVDMPREQRVADAKKNLAVVLNYLTTLQDRGYGDVATVALISTFVAADGKVSAGEFDFIQDILGGNVDYESFYNAAQAAIDTHMLKEMDSIVDHAPREIKRAFLALCLDFISCDGNITPNEIKMFAKYAE